MTEFLFKIIHSIQIFFFLFEGDIVLATSSYLWGHYWHSWELKTNNCQGEDLSLLKYDSDFQIPMRKIDFSNSLQFPSKYTAKTHKGFSPVSRPICQAKQIIILDSFLGQQCERRYRPRWGWFWMLNEMVELYSYYKHPASGWVFLFLCLRPNLLWWCWPQPCFMQYGERQVRDGWVDAHLSVSACSGILKQNWH